MPYATTKPEARQRRRNRIRATLHGTAARPRLSVFRSAKHLQAQLIDDAAGRTLVSVHDRELKTVKGTKSDKAAALGKLLAEKAQAKKITAIIFDRGGYQFHGRVKALAEGARQAGLTF
jgi:large subunit ribosomal protein L18